jgi:rare lipoprotein A
VLPALTRVLPGAAEIAYTSRFSTKPAGVSISSKFVTCCLFSVLTLIGSWAHAQSLPETTSDVAAAIAATTATSATAAVATDTAVASMISTATATGVAAAVLNRIDTWEGKVSYLAHRFTGRKTASGERFDSNALTMAHKTLPFGTLVQVTNPLNGKSVQVRVNDRGPFIAGRVADLSHAAARQIDMLRAGVAHVRLEIVSAFN